MNVGTFYAVHFKLMFAQKLIFIKKKKFDHNAPKVRMILKIDFEVLGAKNDCQFFLALYRVHSFEA